MRSIGYLQVGGKQIKAGINIALQAKAFAKLLCLDASVLRDLTVVTLFWILNLFIFKMWIEKYDIKMFNYFEFSNTELDL